jgi:hypothetical protein
MVIRKDNETDNDQLSLIVENHKAMLQKFDLITIKLDHVTDTLNRHMTQEDAEVKLIKEAITHVEERVLSGFPQKDLVRHHDYHEDVIEETTDKKKRNQEIVTFILKSAIWATLVVITTAIWLYVKVQVKLP